MSAKYSSLNNQFVCQSFFQENIMFSGKSGEFSSQLKQITQGAFPWKFGMQQRCFTCVSHFVTENIKNMYTQGWDFNNINNTYSFVTNIAKKTTFLFLP